MEINFNSCTEEELWKYVATHLKNNGVESVLVGGAVVSIYSKGAYQSGDLDLVLTDHFVKNIVQLMHKIGFVKKSGRHFIHPECKHLFVEFPPGIVEIGDDHNITPDEINVSGTKIKILSPTDCVERSARQLYLFQIKGLLRSGPPCCSRTTYFLGQSIEVMPRRRSSRSF